MSKGCQVMVKIPIVKMFDDVKEPFYATPGSAGMDLRAAKKGHIKPLERSVVRTGLMIALPNGYEAQIRPRSGLAFNYGVTILNSPGTIDSDYRGEIQLILINLSKNTFNFEIGDRLAQMVIAKYETAEFNIVESLDSTHRGSGGLGHTGV